MEARIKQAGTVGSLSSIVKFYFLEQVIDCGSSFLISRPYKNFSSISLKKGKEKERVKGEQLPMRN